MSFPAGPGQGKISTNERAKLLTIARSALRNFLKDGVQPNPSSGADPSSPIEGVFVTLKFHDELRGCIGMMGSCARLEDLVAECAVSAAQDQRFPTITFHEIDGTSIEISVLGRPRRIKSPADVRIGLEGLIVQVGRQRGLLLPQVASERGWTALRFIEEACAKAGLPKNSWRTGAAVEAFPAEVFADAATRSLYSGST